MQAPTLIPHLLDPRQLNQKVLAPNAYRELLKNSQEQLWERFNQGEDVRLLVQARAHTVDQILAHVW